MAEPDDFDLAQQDWDLPTTHDVRRTTGPHRDLAFALGSWACACGLVSIKQLRGTARMSVRLWCHDCGAGAEVMALPPGDSP